MRLSVKRMADGTDSVDIKLLDDGRACIHLLIDDGPIKLEGHPMLTHPSRPKEACYKIACRPQQDTIRSQMRGSVRFVCLTTTEAATATCPQCLAAVKGE